MPSCAREVVGLRSRATGVARLHALIPRFVRSLTALGRARTDARERVPPHKRDPAAASSILREICLRGTARRSLWSRLLFSRVARLTRLFRPSTLTFFRQLTCRMAFTRPESERYSCNQDQILLHRLSNWITQRSGRKDSHKGHEGHEGNTKVVQTRRFEFHLIYLNL